MRFTNILHWYSYLQMQPEIFREPSFPKVNKFQKIFYLLDISVQNLFFLENCQNCQISKLYLIRKMLLFHLAKLGLLELILPLS